MINKIINLVDIRHWDENNDKVGSGTATHFHWKLKSLKLAHCKSTLHIHTPRSIPIIIQFSEHFSPRRIHTLTNLMCTSKRFKGYACNGWSSSRSLNNQFNQLIFWVLFTEAFIKNGLTWELVRTRGGGVCRRSTWFPTF